jgi:predicted NBD/HSP70 family sugar kinase
MTTVAVIALIVGVVGATVTGLFMVASRWALRRESERTAAATFEHDYIVDSVDAAAAQAAVEDDIVDAWLDEMVATLDDAIGDVEALFEAAELVDELDELDALLDDMGVHVGRVDRQAAA